MYKKLLFKIVILLYIFMTFVKAYLEN